MTHSLRAGDGEIAAKQTASREVGKGTAMRAISVMVALTLALPAAAAYCPADRGIYVRDDDGATFTAHRYGEAMRGDVHMGIQEGTLNGQRVFNTWLIGARGTGTGWGESFADSIPGVARINWRAKYRRTAREMVPDDFGRMADDVGRDRPIFPVDASPATNIIYGPLKGFWQFVGCRDE
jgi:hypothetical protein